MENWTNNTLDDWDTSNESIISTEFTTVLRIESDVYSGDYAAQLSSDTESVVMMDVTLPGVLTLGDFVLDIANETEDITGGIPFTDRPESFKGYFKAHPADNDSCMIAIVITR